MELARCKAAVNVGTERASRPSIVRAGGRTGDQRLSSTPATSYLATRTANGEQRLR